ncbi:MAG: hypothetical protein K2X82_08460 [Gemmataceae bacterium]|nr:hypothetical protein [Gemmataceae bacterium]
MPGEEPTRQKPQNAPQTDPKPKAVSESSDGPIVPQNQPRNDSGGSEPPADKRTALKESVDRLFKALDDLPAAEEAAKKAKELRAAVTEEAATIARTIQELTGGGSPESNRVSAQFGANPDGPQAQGVFTDIINELGPLLLPVLLRMLRRRFGINLGS